MKRTPTRPPGSHEPLIQVAVNVPILGQGLTFLVCKAGHVTEAAQHSVVGFKDESGETTQVVLCGRCQFEFFAGTFGGEILPRETTRREAEWKARDMRKDACYQVGLPCCPLATAQNAIEGAAHEGRCQVVEGVTS